MATKFQESDALLLVLDGEQDEAFEIVKSLLPDERRELRAAASVLATLCGQAELRAKFLAEHPAPPIQPKTSQQGKIISDD